MLLRDLGNTPETGQENQAQRALIMAQLEQWCPLLPYMQFYQITGSADTPLKTSTATGGVERVVNTAFPDNVVDPEYGALSLKIFGGKIMVDDAHVRRHAGDPKVALASLRLREINQFARRVGQNLMWAVVNNNSSGAPEKWDGILQQIPSGRTASHSDTLSTDAKTKALIEKMALGVAEVVGGGAFILADAQVIAKISSYASGVVQLGLNQLGQQVKLFQGEVPIITAGYNAAGTRVLPWTSGTGSNATKIIIGRSSEAADIAFASNVGLVVKDIGMVDPHWTTKVEFDIDMDILSDESIYVIDEIQAA